MDKKRLAVNMAAQLLAFAVNMGISFLLAPIIEAKMENTYGFVTLANQFVLYAQIVVSALNTMASRFTTSTEGKTRRPVNIFHRYSLAM